MTTDRDLIRLAHVCEQWPGVINATFRVCPTSFLGELVAGAGGEHSTGHLGEEEA